MPLLQLMVLAAVQGVTEFLPISSSGHLVLVPRLTGWPDQGRMMDVAAHVGTLGAVLLYLRRDVARMTLGLIAWPRGRADADTALALRVAVASLPVFVAGYAVASLLGEALRTIEIIALATIGFALLLWLADRPGLGRARQRRLDRMGAGEALLIGLAQTCALIPGASRAGVTITAARFLGFGRAEAARFSMLLGIPAILGAGGYEGWHLYRSGDLVLTADAGLVALLSLGFALAGIAALMGWLQRGGFGPFILYRLALGAALLALVALG